MSFTGLQYASVYDQPVSVGVWFPSGEKWYNFATGGWESPFDSTKHLLVTTPSAAFPILRGEVIPALALIQGAVIVEFTGSGANLTPTSTTCAPQNYLGPLPIRGTISCY